jgi:hypothetical protein
MFFQHNKKLRGRYTPEFFTSDQSRTASYLTSFDSFLNSSVPATFSS